MIRRKEYVTLIDAPHVSNIKLPPYYFFIMKKPFLLVNFKTYAKGTGKKALEVAKVCDRVSKETGKNIAIVVQPTDIRLISDKVDIPVLAQSIDPIDYGSNTGHILPESVKEAGAHGTVINHSENNRVLDAIEQCIDRSSELNMETVVCASKPKVVAAVSSLEPDIIAAEPPELIGGDVSVSDARPSLISNSVERSDVPVICGAGIKDEVDVEKALELGAQGVFVASGIVKAEDIEGKIRELIRPF